MSGKNNIENSVVTESNPPLTSYCFKWSNYHNHLTEVAQQFLDQESMVDCTIYAGGERLQAHRIVLSSCSSFFADILNQVNEDHSTIILGDIEAEDIRSIVEFAYKGEVRIPVENINSLLQAAHSLKIYGLMEIEGLDESEVSNDTVADDDLTYFDEVPAVDEDESLTSELIVKEDPNKKTEERKRKSSESNSDLQNNKLKQRRKGALKRDYTDEMLHAALDDIRQGCTLLEAASKHRIPRSTLYMRAKSLGITLNPTRNEYTIEDMKQAMEAVINGASLQHASDQFGIPKTVLWRRIQKEGYRSLRQETRKGYPNDKREAAIKALQRGEGLTKVANEYQIPKTTLFRDKTRLVDEGKLPPTVWKKRKTDVEDQKQSRLEEAVEACKTGKMSQAAASATYQIPKTTIWRRLRKDSKRSDSDSPTKKSSKEKDNDDSNSEVIKSEELNEADFETYCPDESELNVTYINESNIQGDPVIILSASDVEDLNLSSNRSMVVVQEGNDNFISCGLELDDNSTFVEEKS